ncbi:LysM peptidoglycan-binding domain-containing protein, partial [Tissierellaceae bacterium HCP3S3_D8]
PTRCPSGTFEYTIRSGDTLFELANRYNTTVQAIIAVNPGVDPNNLRIGQVICIPRGTTPPPTRCPSGTFEYTIRAGDTLFELANRYNTTVQAIIAVNPGIDPNNLRVGQVICIPRGTTPPTRCPSGTFEYTIRAGDTLFELANRYNTTVQAIIAVNPGIDPNNLRIGQVICIPRGTTPPTRCPSGTFEYTIRAGDTLFSLANRYNTTVQAIIAVNPGIDPNNLRVGQVICIPRETPPTRCPSGTFEYTIRAGDTLFSLANRYNTTVQAIIAVNPGIDPNNLRVGQVICIPRGTTPPPKCDGFYYVVRPGDTLFSIARMYNVTVDQLIRVNPGIDPNNLMVGQLVCIPECDDIPCPGGNIYVVRQNDSLASILLRFDISIMDLEAGNPNIDIDRIRVGQELCILPHRDRGCPCEKGTSSYTIRRSDIPSQGTVVEALADKFNTTVAAIMKVNQNLSPGDFVEGKTVCIPDR